MNVSRRWLEAFLRRPLDARELVPRLAMLGAPVDAVEPLHPLLAPVVIGRVEELAGHPNADRLQVCQVAIGAGERRQVVTGATNVAQGRKYPFAGVGVTLPNGLTLEKRKLRGEVSEGMLCSARELGLGDEHEGILELDTEAEPGTPLLEALGLDDERLVLDVSAVRGDLLGHKGVARELAAALEIGFRLPEVPLSGGPERPSVPAAARSAGPAATGGLTVAIEPGSSCRRFTAALIEGVTVGPSPAWLRRRLEAVGQRPINNVVDVTNYVMFELGQPLHAYDAARLRGGRLEARLARPGERLTTLDGITRSLDGGMTVVADAEGAVGVAGVMGGGESEVSDATTTVALEAAWWDPAPTRAARRALGLPTEASQRFERGTDLWALPDALRRAAELILATAGGRVVAPPVDVWPTPEAPPRIFLRRARCTQIIGVELSQGEIERALVAIGATVSPKPDEDRLAVDVPGWRRDLTTEIDLVEEVARIWGYDRLPDDLRPFRPGAQAEAPSELAAALVREGLAALGLFEVVLLPIGPATGPDAVPVLNPLSAEHGFLRERLLPGLVRQVEVNWANHVGDVRLFEIGTAFARGEGAVSVPGETLRLAGVITGAREPAHWTQGGRDPVVDWWDLKGLFARAVSLANPGASVQVGGRTLVARSAGGELVGWAGPLDADRPVWAAPLFGFEVDLDPSPRTGERYRPVPSVPAVSRDLALVVPWSVGAASVVEAGRRAGGALVESVQIVDEYRSDELPEGTRSVAFRFVFRGRDRTLRDTEVDQAMNRIRASVEKQLGLTIRVS